MGIERARWTIGVLACLSVAACGGARPAGGPGAPRPAGQAGEEAAGGVDYEAIYRARQDSARMRFSGADVRFVTGMISHHAQALVMSALAPTQGAGPAVRTLAARIINAQNDEIALMQQWLRDRGQTVPEIHIMGTELMVHGADHGLMPGMLTPDQMRELGEARDSEFDRLFLRYMIQHHRGAVTMVHDLFGTDGASQDDLVFKLASDIQVDQTTEIARMEQMLARMPAGGNGR
jgi:uncharacterized protein (DUF305 family)